MDGWSEHKLRKTWTLLIRLAERLRRDKKPGRLKARRQLPRKASLPAHTWLKTRCLVHSGGRQPLPAQILTWRSVSVHFLRTVIQPEWGGKFWLKVLYRLEECFPRYFGENGQYPLIVIRKPK